MVLWVCLNEAVRNFSVKNYVKFVWQTFKRLMKPSLKRSFDTVPFQSPIYIVLSNLVDVWRRVEFWLELYFFPKRSSAILNLMFYQDVRGLWPPKCFSPAENTKKMSCWEHFSALEPHMFFSWDMFAAVMLSISEGNVMSEADWQENNKCGELSTGKNLITLTKLPLQSTLCLKDIGQAINQDILIIQ